MIVAIDTMFMADRLRYTGTGKYLRHLLSAMLKVVERDQFNIELHGFTHSAENWATNGFESPLLKIHQAESIRRRRLWLLGGMARSTAKAHPDMVFSPTAHSSLPHLRIPLVTTIHDAIPAKLPSNLVGVGKTIHLLTWLNAKLAAKIITVSHWSKKDLVEVYGITSDKVEVIYSGYDEQRYNVSAPDSNQTAALLSRLGIRKPFILHHGMVHLRKNLDRLILAYDRVRGTHRDLDPQLVLAGPMGHDFKAVLEMRDRSPYWREILVTGPLSDDELSLLVKSAFLCVIPSLYEGFCLPMVEAMACGVPTIASSSSCLPEVSGGALEYFDPYSVEAMADAMRRVIDDSTLRDRLQRAGLTRAAEFRWQRCAQETVGVFADLCDISLARTVASSQ